MKNNINDILKIVFNNSDDNQIYSRKQLFKKIKDKYPQADINPWLPSDYCYNRWNKSISNFNKQLHLFEYSGRNKYRILGPDYKYSGNIFHGKNVIGKWKDGILTKTNNN